MCLKSTSEFVQLETWLDILTSTYKIHPTVGLAKTINYYLMRLLHHDDIGLNSDKRCGYLSMQKYWRWQINR